MFEKSEDFDIGIQLTPNEQELQKEIKKVCYDGTFRAENALSLYYLDILLAKQLNLAGFKKEKI